MRFGWLVLALALVACGDDDSAPSDLGPAEPDAFADGGGMPVDAAPMDAGEPLDGATDAASPDGGPPDLGPPTPAIVLGTGQLDWEALPADGTLELDQGSQGGVHLTLALQLWSVDPNRLLLRYEGFDAETDEALFLPLERLIGPGGVLEKDDHLVRAGDRLVLDEVVIGRADLIGKDVRLEVVATPDGGDPLSTSAVVTVVDER